MKKPINKILLFLPCYNEAENCVSVLKEIKQEKEKVEERHAINFDVLVINDGSTDITADTLKNHQSLFEFQVLNLPQNKGYGYVIKRGFQIAQQKSYDYVISFDIDGQHESQFISQFVDFLIQNNTNNYDIVSGSRYLDAKLFWQQPWKDRFLVNTVITGVLNTFGFSFTDAFCGFKAYRVDRLSKLNLTLDGYEMPIQLWMEAQKNNFHIVEKSVPVIYKDRDMIMKKRTSESFLFKEGEKRIEKYVNIIAQFAGYNLSEEIVYLQDIFRSYFNSIEEITQSNFETVRRHIFGEIDSLKLETKPCLIDTAQLGGEHNGHRAGCTCCGCASR
ncbi:Undecaprenyl-phosphate 4-deoxy-4-formamido-L-arabinose transferase [Candidatus Lokiarchaeum ossiferum]|uniref:Undecaprenyl-phosphate 4-deoxy-4-formamido-L-arabinose transferase n=1 Tax=Candidatus Lokiarchaeum ossiferum TaxID=2951803 RepID=A0ABY6HYT9_9ARCH|nr:Undecaprenyl-phosphate 4-deoxy-4-formamido-L-arabinose transferase [Candidatus Lokiarchaeum sp. B-35]